MTRPTTNGSVGSWLDDVTLRCLPACVFAAAQRPRLDQLRDTSVEARVRNLCRKSYDTEQPSGTLTKPPVLPYSCNLASTSRLCWVKKSTPGAGVRPSCSSYTSYQIILSR